MWPDFWMETTGKKRRIRQVPPEALRKKNPASQAAQLLELHVSSQRGRNVLRRACSARLQRQVRESPRAQLSRARDSGGTATRRNRLAGGFRASEANYSRGHGAAGSPVHERPGAFQGRESFRGKRSQVLLRRDHQGIERHAAGRPSYGRGSVGDGYEPGAVPARLPNRCRDVLTASYPMNRAFLIIFIPAILVVTGYILVLRSMGLAPGYPRLVVALAVFLAAVYWLSRRKAGSGAKDKP